MKEIGDIGVAGNEDNQLPWGNGQSVGRALPLKPKALEQGLDFESLDHFKAPKQDAQETQIFEHVQDCFFHLIPLVWRFHHPHRPSDKATPAWQVDCADVLIRGLPAHEERSGNCPAR